ncbi:MAG: TlpA family protein disulfide reductase [Candidatus Hydrothermarchaeales archaeon]
MGQGLNCFCPTKKLDGTHLKKTLVGLLVFSFLYFTTFARNTEGFFHKREQPLPAGQDLFKKLKIERFSEKVLAPDFTLADLTGNRVGVGSLKGKVVFMNFWATWCVPCRQEMPTMEKLHREMKDQGLGVVAVNIRESPKAVQDFVDGLGLTFTVLFDREGEVSKAYGAWGIPLTYIINRKGEFVGKVMGYREWDSQEAVAFFRRLMAEKP